MRTKSPEKISSEVPVNPGHLGLSRNRSNLPGVSPVGQGKPALIRILPLEIRHPRSVLPNPHLCQLHRVAQALEPPICRSNHHPVPFGAAQAVFSRRPRQRGQSNTHNASLARVIHLIPPLFQTTGRLCTKPKHLCEPMYLQHREQGPNAHDASPARAIRLIPLFLAPHLRIKLKYLSMYIRHRGQCPNTCNNGSLAQATFLIQPRDLVVYLRIRPKRLSMYTRLRG